MERILVGVAWPYANGPIHVGHVAGCYLPPDIFARYHRMKGDEVLMVSGSDQHGTPITITADQEGVSPAEIAEKFHKINSEALEKLGISFDLFFETSHINHKAVVHDIFLKLLENGYIYKQTMESFYCNQCQRFLPDRYVEGECPHCGHENARGDQCDECGRTLDAPELIAAKCKICESYPEIRETEHFFFKLSEFQDQLIEYASDKEHWRHNTKNFTRNWLASGLRDRAITRDITWGVEIPIEGYEDKRIYVWFEAVIGYLSTSKEWARRSGNEDKWKDFWMDESVKHYYFLGKDNIPFHTIIWPAILMGYGGLNLPYDVPANEYLKFKGEQFSKSRGISVDIPDYLEHYAPDPLRYYLSINMPENRDAEFSWVDFINRNNTELVGALGNFIHRVLTFTHKNFGGVPPLHVPIEDLPAEDKEALAKIQYTYDKVEEHIRKCQFKQAMKEVMALAHFGNKYFDKKAPWSVIKEDKDACGTALNINLRIVKALNVLVYPFLPFASAKLWNMLGYEGEISSQPWEIGLEELQEGQRLQTPETLFDKLELEQVSEPQEEAAPSKEEKKEAKEMISFDEFMKMEMKIGEVKSVEDHPDADKLYVMKVDFGEGDEDRQIVAGLKGYYEKDNIVGKKIVVVTNLQPAKLRGVESFGMLLAAEDKSGTLALLTPDRDIDKGAEVK
ncbi:MAG: methionine--tRNA ligase [Thermoplasmata archaeon]|nr:methionine--tRNA ligase [Thermoplasmata archaeon]